MGGNEMHELMLLDEAGRALMESKDFDEIKDIRDKAEAVRKYAQSASLGLDIQNRAAEVKLRAERRAGKLLNQLQLRGGDRKSKHRRERLKLDDLGISKNQSTRWQREALVPEEVFRQYVQKTREAHKELTAAGLMRLARTAKAGSRANGKSRPARYNGLKATPPPTDIGRPDLELSFDEVVSELKNHCEVLDGILRPYYTGDAAKLRPEEQRVLQYLIGETKHLLESLAQLPVAEVQLSVVDRASA